MRRSTILATLLAACLLAPAEAGALRVPDAGAPLAWVKVGSCSRLDHTAAFYGRMNRIPGAERMAMRFTLLVRGDDDFFGPVRAPALSRWRKSKPGVRAFGYRQRVRGLVDGSLYRVQVDYRWYDEDGAVVRRARRRSGTCSQAGPMPNLRVKILDAAPTQIQGVTRYRVRVSNRGSALAEAVEVRLAVDGAAVDTQTIDELDAGDVNFLTFRGPSCESDVQATVDPAGTVQETAEDDNVQARSCDELAPG
jgi:CARDB protein